MIKIKIMDKKISILVIGCGNMGASHAISYENHNGFKICGLVSRGESKVELNNKLKSESKDLCSAFNLFLKNAIY